MKTIYATNITADTLIKQGAGKFYGFTVNSHTSGTLKVWDSTAASGKVINNTITFAAGSGITTFFSEGINFSTGLFADVGGTIDLTVYWGGLE